MIRNIIIGLLTCTSLLCSAQDDGCFKPAKLKRKKLSGGSYFRNRSYGFSRTQKEYTSGFGVENSMLDGISFYYYFSIELDQDLYLANNIGISHAYEPMLYYYNINYDPSYDYGVYAISSPRIYLSNRHWTNKGKSTKNYPGEFVGLKLGAYYFPKFDQSKFYYVIGINIGARRVFLKRIMLEASFGLINSTLTNDMYYSDSQEQKYIVPEINLQCTLLTF